MKQSLSLILSFLMSLSSWAFTAVQRTSESSYSEYKAYLIKSEGVSFADAFIQTSGVMELETPLLEKCLEDIYLGAPGTEVCWQAVVSLTSRPLNSARRDILFSFLGKLEKVKSPRQSFYQDLKRGLLRTHPQMAKDPFPDAESEAPKTGIQELEMKAWRKALSKILPLEEVALLINGKKVSRLEKWSAPIGIYQWCLITNTHEPLIRLGSFSQFAAESLKSLKPLAPVSCQDLPDLDAKKYGILQLEVFSNSKCISKFGMASTLVQSEHLVPANSKFNIEKSSSRHWIWPTLLVVGVGIASSLKNKQVSVQWPGAH